MICDPPPQKKKHVVWNRERIRLKNGDSTILLLCVYVSVYVEVSGSVTLPSGVINLSTHTEKTHTLTL